MVANEIANIISLVIKANINKPLIVPRITDNGPTSKLLFKDVFVHATAMQEKRNIKTDRIIKRGPSIAVFSLGQNPLRTAPVTNIEAAKATPILDIKMMNIFLVRLIFKFIKVSPSEASGGGQQSWFYYSTLRFLPR